MTRNAHRLLAVTALTMGMSGLFAISAPLAHADRVCIINGKQEPCPTPEYENDCEGAVQRPDCGGEQSAATTNNTESAGSATGSTTNKATGGAKKAPKRTTPKATSPKKSTTTQRGNLATTTTVDETTGEVTVTTISALSLADIRENSRYPNCVK